MQAVPGQAEVPLLQLGLEPQADGVLDGDDVLRVAERVRHRFAADAAGRAERVPHRGVEEVERGDVDDLAPPPQAAARLGVRFGAPLGHAEEVGRRRPPMANDGAPSRLTTRFSRYSSRPSATACSVGTPSGRRNSANSPSRTPRPEMLIGEHLRDGDRGEEGEERGGAGGLDAEGPRRHDRRPDEDELVGEAHQEHAGRLARVPAELVEAHAHRGQEPAPALLRVHVAVAVAGHREDHQGEEHEGAGGQADRHLRRLAEVAERRGSRGSRRRSWPAAPPSR